MGDVWESSSAGEVLCVYVNVCVCAHMYVCPYVSADEALWGMSVLVPGELCFLCEFVLYIRYIIFLCTHTQTQVMKTSCVVIQVSEVIKFVCDSKDSQ